MDSLTAGSALFLRFGGVRSLLQQEQLGSSFGNRTSDDVQRDVCVGRSGGILTNAFSLEGSGFPELSQPA
jgi:hypothetical protein